MTDWANKFTEFTDCYVYIELHSHSQMRGDCEVGAEFVTLVGPCCSDEECDLTTVTVINKKSIAAMRMVVTPIDDDGSQPPTKKESLS